MSNRRYLGVGISVLAVAVGTMMGFVSGCPTGGAPAGGGGGGGLKLSSAKLNPGQFLTVSHTSIAAGSTVDVRFEGPGGFEVEVETILTENGTAKVAVPPLIDMQTGEFLEGEVQVSLPDLPGSSAALSIQGLPQINSPSPGALLREVFSMSLEVADAAEAKAAAIAAELPGAVESPSDLEFFTQQRAAIAGILDELDATGQLTVEAADGTIVTLTAQDLALGDRLLASYLVGIIDETGGDSTVALKSTTLFQGQGGPILDYEALAAEFRRVANNIVNGGGAFLGSMTLIVTGGGMILLGTGPLAAVGGLVLTAGGAVWAIGSSSIANRIGSFFDDKLADLYNIGQTAFSGAISVGTEALGTLKGKLGQLFSVVSSLLTAKSTYDNFTQLECQTNPPQGQKRSEVNFQTGGFCVRVEPAEQLTCTNDCEFADDGVCDDGGPGSTYDDCVLGTDCADCGTRGDDGTADGDGENGGCTNTCDFAYDDVCDDSGPGSTYDDCALGTDCADCGPRDSGEGTSDPQGTCCATDGDCTMTSAVECVIAGGALWLEGESCTPNPCSQPTESTGACCSSGTCQTISQADCAFIGGVYQGEGASCTACETATTEYVIWYTGNVCCWGAPLIYLSTRDSFNLPESAASYPGGGIDYTVPLEKVEFQGGFASPEEAQAWVCPQFTSSYFHYWCTRHYQMNGMNWQPTASLGCDLSNLPEPAVAPDVNGCQ